MFIKKIFNLHIINIFKIEQHVLMFTNPVALHKPYLGLMYNNDTANACSTCVLADVCVTRINFKMYVYANTFIVLKTNMLP